MRIWLAFCFCTFPLFSGFTFLFSVCKQSRKGRSDKNEAEGNPCAERTPEHIQIIHDDEGDDEEVHEYYEEEESDGCLQGCGVAESFKVIEGKEDETQRTADSMDDECRLHGHELHADAHDGCAKRPSDKSVD